jgi:hypothetical protein
MKIPVNEVLMLAIKIIRCSRGGFTRDEISDLVADLLTLAALLTALLTAPADVPAEVDL